MREIQFEQVQSAFERKLHCPHAAKGRKQSVGFTSPATALVRFMDDARKRADIDAQHGTVRILVKDGKPVGPQAA